jgi:membrane-bound serine protease (ClpP class)
LRRKSAVFILRAVGTIVILLLAGAALLLLETVLPGLIAGIVGLGCLVTGVIMAYTDFGARTGNIILAAVVASLVIGTLCWMKFLPDSRLAKRFVSQRSVGNLDVEKPELLHQTGTAITHLRPSGMALINQRRIDVVTEGQMVQRGQPVKVVAIEGMRVVVRPLS